MEPKRSLSDGQCMAIGVGCTVALVAGLFVTWLLLDTPILRSVVNPMGH